MIRGFILAIVLVVVFYALSFVLFVSTLPRTPDTMPRADGIVALTGGDTRLDAAASLLEHGRAKRMLVSGVDQATSRATLKNVMHGGAWFDCCVDLGYAGEDTRGNAQEAAGWAHDHGFKSIVLVTARYHMPRACQEFRHLMPAMKLTPYPVEENGIDLSAWWRHRSTTLLLQREYAKYLTALVMTAIT
jgi:uncharacterized SAM-binding protein YcdF (DUF218 family)